MAFRPQLGHPSELGHARIQALHHHALLAEVQLLPGQLHAAATRGPTQVGHRRQELTQVVAEAVAWLEVPRLPTAKTA